MGLSACAPTKVEEEAAPKTDEGEQIFLDESAATGLDFIHFNGASGRFYFPEIGGPGGALIDYDNDGDLDLYLVQGQLLDDSEPEESLFPPSFSLEDRLFRNDLEIGPDGSRLISLTDVTEESGLSATGYGMGVAVGDYDNDGFVDLYVTHFGANQLWRNRGGDGFEDVTQQARVDDPRWSTSAEFFDFDRDGWLDLFVTSYVEYRLGTHRACRGPTGRQDYCGPQAYRGQHDRLFRNTGPDENGRVTFEDFTARAGLLETSGSGLGVIAADFDDDGWLDLYVANDLMPNHLWFNQGLRADGEMAFREGGLLAGAALNMQGKAEASMGVTAGDLDNDGDEDLFMTHLSAETSTLYLNDGQGVFEDRTRSARMGATLALTGFGTAMLDFDNDGWLDIASVNGAVFVLSDREITGDPFPFDQPNQLFRNRGRGPNDVVFEKVDAGAAFEVAETSRGLSAGDIDNDGDTDLVVFNDAGPTRLLINQIGQDNSWLGLRLVGSEFPRDMLGAKVELVFPDGSRMTRRVRTGGSYCSANDPRVLFGLGGWSDPSLVRVRWPSGVAEEFDPPERRRYSTLVQGSGRAVADSS